MLLFEYQPMVLILWIDMYIINLKTTMKKKHIIIARGECMFAKYSYFVSSIYDIPLWKYTIIEIKFRNQIDNFIDLFLCENMQQLK